MYIYKEYGVIKVKKLLIGLFLATSVVSLTACSSSNTSTKTDTSKSTEISKENISKSPQTSDSQKKDNADENIPQTITLSDGNIWKKDEEVSKYVGTFSGEAVLSDQPGIKMSLTVNLTIKDDGSYNLFTYTGTKDTNSASYYINSENKLQKTVSFSDIKYTTGVITRQYGNISASSLISTMPYIFLDQSGNPSVQENYVSGYDSPNFESARIDATQEELLFSNGNITYDTKTNGKIVLNKSSITSSNESLYQKEKKWSIETQQRQKAKASQLVGVNQDNSITYKFSNQNDFLQFVQPYLGFSDNIELLNPQDYSNAYTRDNKKIQTKYAIKVTDTVNSRSNIYLYDGNNVFKGDLLYNPVQWELFMYTV